MKRLMAVARVLSDSQADRSQERSRTHENAGKQIRRQEDRQAEVIYASLAQHPTSLLVKPRIVRAG